ncbi:MAG: glycosyltransferase family 2 protein [Halothiobacillaceae bacterium]|nr:glycosyltransferase family 2 protein [Halothiobacillaceae bacterium]
MKRILTVCIPTYKRPLTLSRCIDSVRDQIEQYSLSNHVDICVANDASPDDTVDVLHAYESLGYFHGITRERNLGMNVNIKYMLAEAAEKSCYQLIITDDDFLQPDVLQEVVELLRRKRDDNVPAIWTPRHSYTEDGKLHCISCSPFRRDTCLRPSAARAGRHMVNGFVLSGLIVCTERIDFEFWERYRENAYFPMIFFGDLLHRGGACYWHRNIVHHTVLNKCHWESWGRNDLLIEIRKISDYLNTYALMGARMDGVIETALFYAAAFPGIVRATAGFMHSKHLSGEREAVLGAVDEQKAKGIFRLMPALQRLMPFALLAGTALVLAKLAVLNVLCRVNIPRAQAVRHRQRLASYGTALKNLPVIIRLLSREP